MFNPIPPENLTLHAKTVLVFHESTASCHPSDTIYALVDDDSQIDDTDATVAAAANRVAPAYDDGDEAPQLLTSTVLPTH